MLKMEINNRKKDAFLPLIIALVLAVGILIGMRFNNGHTLAGNNRRELLFFAPSGKVGRVLDLIVHSYVDSISANALETEAIAGMVNILDPHSQYIPAKSLASVNESIEGNLSGIGIQVNMFNDTIVVVNTVADGPSEKAGMFPGDRIVRVNDSLVAGVKLSSADIIGLLKGKTETQVKVTVHRRDADSLIHFNITRGKIPLYSIVAAYMATPGTGYIKVNRFSKTTMQEFTAAMSRLTAQGMKNLILDLRENGGGVIDAAIGMSELFLPAGKLIVYTEGNERPRTDYYSMNKDTTYTGMRLALLIDESSASASEIVAGAVQDNDRGTIIGRRSFGKALVQEQFPLSDGSAIRITIARYYTPTGRCIQKPYSKDEKQYYNELNERYMHGELLQADSIRFDESLKYATPGGKVVYGGGGIMPDIFVPIDTAATGYYRQIAGKRLMYRFAFDYADRHRRELMEHPDCTALEAALRRKNILDRFVLFAAGQGVARNDRDLRVSGSIIENTVIAYIAGNIFNDNGFFSIFNKKDQTVQKAIEQLSGNAPQAQAVNKKTLPADNI
jgi:carboxyl-terminal processing protease